MEQIKVKVEHAATTENALYRKLISQIAEDKTKTIVEVDGYYVLGNIPEPSEQEQAESQIEFLMARLADTDYKAIKFAEGEISDEEYEPIKTQRREWRKAINELRVKVN